MCNDMVDAVLLSLRPSFVFFVAPETFLGIHRALSEGACLLAELTGNPPIVSPHLVRRHLHLRQVLP